MKLTGWPGDLVRELGDLVSDAAIDQAVMKDIPGGLVSKLIVRIY